MAQNQFDNKAISAPSGGLAGWLGLSLAMKKKGGEIREPNIRNIGKMIMENKK